MLFQIYCGRGRGDVPAFVALFRGGAKRTRAADLGGAGVVPCRRARHRPGSDVVCRPAARPEERDAEGGPGTRGVMF